MKKISERLLGAQSTVGSLPRIALGRRNRIALMQSELLRHLKPAFNWSRMHIITCITEIKKGLSK